MHTYDIHEIEEDYQKARIIYAEYGVDTDSTLEALDKIPLSLHCWQGDDVTGFEAGRAGLSGDGILATGNYVAKRETGRSSVKTLTRLFALYQASTA